jgi:hypothetical protein
MNWYPDNEFLDIFERSHHFHLISNYQRQYFMIIHI